MSHRFIKGGSLGQKRSLDKRKTQKIMRMTYIQKSGNNVDGVIICTEERSLLSPLVGILSGTCSIKSII